MEEQYLKELNIWQNRTSYQDNATDDSCKQEEFGKEAFLRIVWILASCQVDPDPMEPDEKQACKNWQDKSYEGTFENGG